MAEGFDDGVVLDELLRVGVGELDGAAPAEEVFGRSDGGTELGVDGVTPVRGQARDGVDVHLAEEAGPVEEEGLDAARGAERGWGFVREGVEGLTKKKTPQLLSPEEDLATTYPLRDACGRSLPAIMGP